jgi:murein DD-endopeptidase MepM/ murein hydrolase activator NlpD
MKKYYTILIIFLFLTGLNAEQKIYLDNDEIQEYKGKLGKWFQVESIKALLSLSKKYSADIKEVNSINNIEKKFFKSYYFIPYSEEYLKELEKKNIQRIVITTGDEEFIWPISEVIDTSSVLGFRNGKFHSGLDLPVVGGKPIIASMEGLVTYSNYTAGYGKVIIIEHRDNFSTKYAHNYMNFVKKGDFVKKGQIIGLVGSTGQSTGNHLHFEIRCKEIPLDPLDFLPHRDELRIIHTLKNWK